MYADLDLLSSGFLDIMIIKVVVGLVERVQAASSVCIGDEKKKGRGRGGGGGGERSKIF